MQIRHCNAILVFIYLNEVPNGLRYLRWGGDGEAVQPEKCQGAESCLRCAQNPERQVHAVLGGALVLTRQNIQE